MAWSFLEKTILYNTQSKQNTQKRQIIRLLAYHQELSIPELCKFLKLSVPTGTKMVEEFERDQILVKVGKRDSSGGRRPVTFSLNPNEGLIIGIEITIRAFRLGILNLDREVVYEFSSSSIDIRDKQATIDFLLRQVPEILQNAGLPAAKILGAGIGISGRVDHQKGTSYTYLNTEQPLSELLQKAWGFPVFIDNDTHLLAWGENSFSVD